MYMKDSLFVNIWQSTVLEFWWKIHLFFWNDIKNIQIHKQCDKMWYVRVYGEDGIEVEMNVLEKIKL